MLQYVILGPVGGQQREETSDGVEKKQKLSSNERLVGARGLDSPAFPF